MPKNYAIHLGLQYKKVNVIAKSESLQKGKRAQAPRFGCTREVYSESYKKEMDKSFIFLYNPFMLTKPLQVSPQLLLYGLDTPHDPKFVVERPGPRNDWVILCFRTPFLMRTADGLETGQPGDCIIHDPDFPEWHTTLAGEKEGFRNDWLHIGKSGMKGLVQQFEIPVNRRMPTGSASFLSENLRVIADEDRRREAFWQERIRIEIKKISLRLGRVQQNYNAAEILSVAEQAHFIRFKIIRTRMLEHFREPWDIVTLADQAYLSPNRFSVLYAKFFKISPIEELLRHRIQHSRTMLIYSDDILESIAEACGFTDAAYFSRVFKKRMGCNPGAYRKLSISLHFR